MRQRASDSARRTTPVRTGHPAPTVNVAALCGEGLPGDWVRLGQQVLSEALRRATRDFQQCSDRLPEPGKLHSQCEGHA
jgi:hypothetical protein